MPLSEQSRAKLDGIVQQMVANKESDDTIQTVVNDFKQKYDSAGASTQSNQGVYAKELNYKTGNAVIDAPLGLAQGAIKGLDSTATAVGSGLRRLAGLQPIPVPKEELEGQNGWQKTGKFVEQAAEYAVPGGMVGKAVKGAMLPIRAGAQALTSGAVSAAQSGGDPTATILGAGLGAGGEVLGAGVGVVKNALGNRAPTLANFAESFGNATPTQKARISDALDTLKRDGVKPGADIHEMQDVIKGKLNDLGQAYQGLDPAIQARTQPVSDVVQRLQKAQQAYTKRGVVTDKGAYSALQDQIDTVQQIAAQNNGNVQLDDLIHLKQLANGRTNFQSPEAEKSIWNKVGNAYRESADALAPETTPLNRDYQKYKDLEQIVDQNVARGKGTTPSGLDSLLHRAASHGVGAAAGAEVGHMVAGAPGAAVGSLAGGIFGPKLAKATQQLIQNAVDNGSFQALPAGKQAMVKIAAKMGDNKAIIRLLGQSTGQELALQGAQ